MEQKVWLVTGASKGIRLQIVLVALKERNIVVGTSRDAKKLAQAVLLQMRKQKAGNIINLASISGTVTGPTQEIYSATKAEVIRLSEALATEVEPFGIKVTAIAPGVVRTDFLDQTSLREPAKTTQSQPKWRS